MGFIQYQELDGDIYPSLITNDMDIEGGRVLTFRDAEFLYYGKGKTVSHLDRRMEGFYKSKSFSEAIKVLRNLDIRYAYVPNYTEPTIKNSYLKDIIYNPYRSFLIEEGQGYMLLKIGGGQNEKPDLIHILSENNYNKTPPGIYSKGMKYPSNYKNDNIAYIPTTTRRVEYILNLNLEGGGCLSVMAKYISNDIWGYNIKVSSISIINISGRDDQVFRFVKPSGVSGVYFNFKNYCSERIKIKSFSLYSVRR